MVFSNFANIFSFLMTTLKHFFFIFFAFFHFVCVFCLSLQQKECNLRFENLIFGILTILRNTCLAPIQLTLFVILNIPKPHYKIGKEEGVNLGSQFSDRTRFGYGLIKIATPVK